MRLTNEEEGWCLVLEEGLVQLIQIDFRLGLFLADASDSAKLFVGGECIIWADGSPQALTPEDPSSLAPILAFRNAKVARVSIRNTGYLRLDFKSGESLEVKPNDRYESWELGCSTGLMMICSPGGSVSLFRDRDNESVMKPNVTDCRL